MSNCGANDPYRQPRCIECSMFSSSCDCECHDYKPKLTASEIIKALDNLDSNELMGIRTSIEYLFIQRTCLTCGILPPHKSCGHYERTGEVHLNCHACLEAACDEIKAASEKMRK